MRSLPDICVGLQGKLIVSCQASEGDAFRDPSCMARFAQAAVKGGAAGIRANGAEDVRAIRQAVSVPIIGISKSPCADAGILITPSLEAAQELVQAGADLVALDATSRGQRYGAHERLRRIKSELGVPVLADIATAEEAVAAAAAGADFVLSTMRGYTAETAHVKSFEAGFIEELVRAVDVPVMAEGRIQTPEQARAALRAGAFAVIIGTAITRPEEITRRFVLAMETQPASGAIIGIDLGGTNTKFGVVLADGRLIAQGHVATPPGGGRQVLLGHLKFVARQCLDLAHQAGIAPAALGVATAGWVNPYAGSVVYATENLPGWTGTEIAAELQPVAGVGVAVENDANALAAAEKHFGLARDLGDFVCITLGTGVGGGCYVGGRLNRGAHFFANALGHIPIERGGWPCTCGLRGCLEAYANAAALVRYAGGAFASAEAVISGANSGDMTARGAMRTYAGFLAAGVAAIVHLLDPEAVILSGGLAQNNPHLIRDLEQQLATRLTVPECRRLRVQVSELGYYSGVYGAAAVARENLAR